MKSITLFITGAKCWTRVGARLLGVLQVLVLWAARDLGRQVFAVAPFLPRAGVIADSWIAEQTQRDIAVRGAVAALAVGQDFLVGCDAGGFVHRTQVGRRPEVSVRGEIARP